MIQGRGNGVEELEMKVEKGKLWLESKLGKKDEFSILVEEIKMRSGLSTCQKSAA